MAIRIELRKVRRGWAMHLTLCIALFAALAPTVSRALAFAGGNQLILVCTGSGSKYVSVTADNKIDSETQKDKESGHSLSHCPFCLHSSDRVAIPPTPFAHLFGTEDKPKKSTPWQAVYIAHISYPCAFARGPPLIA